MGSFGIKNTVGDPLVWKLVMTECLICVGSSFYKQPVNISGRSGQKIFVCCYKKNCLGPLYQTILCCHLESPIPCKLSCPPPPRGGTQLWVGYGCAARSFDHHPITKPEKTQICYLYQNHSFFEGPFLKPISAFYNVNWDAKPESPKKHPIWAPHPRTHLSTKYPPPPVFPSNNKIKAQNFPLSRKVVLNFPYDWYL